MINLDSPLFNTLIFYFLIIFIIILLKPKFLYSSSSSKFKLFGSDYNKTFFAFPVIIILLSISLYMTFLSIQLFI